jgi:hypothetical protein
MQQKQTNLCGTIVEVSDIALAASIIDSVRREPHQIVTVLLDKIPYYEFMKLASAKKVKIIIDD